MNASSYLPLANQRTRTGTICGRTSHKQGVPLSAAYRRVYRQLPQRIEIVSPARVAPLRLTANSTPDVHVVFDVRYQHGCGPPDGDADVALREDLVGDAGRAQHDVAARLDPGQRRVAVRDGRVQAVRRERASDRRSPAASAPARTNRRTGCSCCRWRRTARRSRPCARRRLAVRAVRRACTNARWRGCIRCQCRAGAYLTRVGVHRARDRRHEQHRRIGLQRLDEVARSRTR